MDWENHLEKKPIQKIEETVKIITKLPHMKKTLGEKVRFFFQTPFSHPTLKLERKKIMP